MSIFLGMCYTIVACAVTSVIATFNRDKIIIPTVSGVLWPLAALVLLGLWVAGVVSDWRRNK